MEQNIVTENEKGNMWIGMKKLLDVNNLTKHIHTYFILYIYIYIIQ